MTLRIGLDFDNTLVDYDRLFARVAREQGIIPAGLPPVKSRVRDYLRRRGREADWTRLQGLVYGERMAGAELFPDVREFFAACRAWRLPVVVISHKTRFPYLGPRRDLHRAALDWMRAQGFFDRGRIGLPRRNVFFELSKEAKLRRIARSRCGAFLDDLPEFLLEPGFPEGVFRFLFDPKHIYPRDTRYRKIGSWSEYATLIGNLAGRGEDRRAPSGPGGLRGRA